MTPVRTTVLAVLIVALGLIASVRFGNASTLFGQEPAKEPICRASIVAAEPSIGPCGSAGYPNRPHVGPTFR